MRHSVSAFASIAFVVTAIGQTANVPTLPTWDDEIARGLMPYRQLTAKDFAIDDHAHPESGFWIKTIIDPRYRCRATTANGQIYLYVEQWVVFSGFDQKETSRKSALKNMNAELPYAQAMLDINEIYARQLAAFRPGDLPSGHGPTLIIAQADLASRVRVFCGKSYERAQTERSDLAAATKNGENKKKVRELAKKIKQRLAATVRPASMPDIATGASTASPSPSVSLSPAVAK